MFFIVYSHRNIWCWKMVDWTHFLLNNFPRNAALITRCDTDARKQKLLQQVISVILLFHVFFETSKKN